MVRYDKKSDAKYITLLPEKQKRGVVARTEKVKPWLLVDYDKDGNVYGIEILNASKNPLAFLVKEDTKPASKVKARTKSRTIAAKERVFCV